MMIRGLNLFFMIFHRFPTRIARLLFHFSYWIPGNHYTLPNRPSHILIWISDFIFYILDCLGLGEIFTVVFMILYPKSRGLTASEIKMLTPLFDNSIRYSDVLIIPDSNEWTKKFAHAFVLFNTIHYHEELKDHILVHEMVHVYQYQHFGSMYIGRALNAQHFGEGYEYGSSTGLYKAMISGKKFKDFNFEQQGQIMEDYYLNFSDTEVWPMNLDVAVYRYYLDDMFITG